MTRPSERAAAFGPAGGEPLPGQALSFERNVLSLRLERAFAPGAPMSGFVETDGAPVSVRGKAIGSRRDGESFVVRLRIFDLPRHELARLAHAFTPT